VNLSKKLFILFIITASFFSISLKAEESQEENELEFNKELLLMDFSSWGLEDVQDLFIF